MGLIINIQSICGTTPPKNNKGIHKIQLKGTKIGRNSQNFEGGWQFYREVREKEGETS